MALTEERKRQIVGDAISPMVDVGLGGGLNSASFNEFLMDPLVSQEDKNYAIGFLFDHGYSEAVTKTEVPEEVGAAIGLAFDEKAINGEGVSSSIGYDGLDFDGVDGNKAKQLLANLYSASLGQNGAYTAVVDELGRFAAELESDDSILNPMSVGDAKDLFYVAVAADQDLLKEYIAKFPEKDLSDPARNPRSEEVQKVFEATLRYNEDQFHGDKVDERSAEALGIYAATNVFVEYPEEIFSHYTGRATGVSDSEALAKFLGQTAHDPSVRELPISLPTGGGVSTVGDVVVSEFEDKYKELISRLEDPTIASGDQRIDEETVEQKRDRDAEMLGVIASSNLGGFKYSEERYEDAMSSNEAAIGMVADLLPIPKSVSDVVPLKEILSGAASMAVNAHPRGVLDEIGATPSYKSLQDKTLEILRRIEDETGVSGITGAFKGGAAYENNTNGYAGKDQAGLHTEESMPKRFSDAGATEFAAVSSSPRDPKPAESDPFADLALACESGDAKAIEAAMKAAACSPSGESVTKDAVAMVDAREAEAIRLAALESEKARESGGFARA